MLRKTIKLLLLSSVALLALEPNDTLSQEVKERLSLEENKIYVIDFFASWCKSCRKELPLVSKLYEQNKINLIGVNVDSNSDDGKALVDELSVKFPIVYDEDKKLVESFNPLGFPAIYYVKDGKVVDVIFGAVSEIDKKILEDIEEIK